MKEKTAAVESEWKAIKAEVKYFFFNDGWVVKTADDLWSGGEPANRPFPMPSSLRRVALRMSALVIGTWLHRAHFHAREKCDENMWGEVGEWETWWFSIFSQFCCCLYPTQVVWLSSKVVLLIHQSKYFCFRSLDPSYPQAGGKSVSDGSSMTQLQVTQRYVTFTTCNQSPLSPTSSWKGMLSAVNVGSVRKQKCEKKI